MLHSAVASPFNVLNWKAVLQNGQQRMIQNIYIRGSKIRFVIVPDMMKNAPMFKRVDPKYKDKLPKMGESGFARKNHVRRTDKRT